MAIACFWPFHAPRNTASWISGRTGIAFGDRGVLVGHEPLGLNHPDISACTLDLWLEPDRSDHKGTILATYTPANPRLLKVEQYEDGLAVRALEPGDPTRTGGAQLYVDRVFGAGKPVLVTITSDDRGAEVFVNGIFRRANPNFRICSRLLSGKVVAGTAAGSDDAWQGLMTGLAVFRRALSRSEVLEQYKSWPAHPDSLFGLKASSNSQLIALYLFGEGAGTRVRDAVSEASSLYIPERYVVVSQPFLERPSLENHLDIIANIIGFIPLGFTLCGYLASYRRRGSAIVMTILLCGLFSLLIESLQWFLPTRDSDMTDVITNFIGGSLGAVLYHVSIPWLEANLNTKTST